MAFATRPDPHEGLLKVRPRWRSEDVLGPRPMEGARLSIEMVDDLRDLFEVDAATEYDARHLYRHLAPRMAGYPIPLRRFLETWRADEENHYRGLRRLLSDVTGEPECRIDARMAERAPDFSPIEPFLSDPFSLLVTFAYDERVTVQAYATDYALYTELGSGPAEWVRRTNRDEALHYRNALSLTRHLYGERLDEAADILSALVAFDQRRDRYRATFLLDHDDDGHYFTDARLRRCAEIVERSLGNG